MLDRFKEHVKEHKTEYACAGGIIIGASFTLLIMRGKHTTVGNAALDRLDTINVHPLSILSRQINNVVTVIEREGPGHPGYITRCLETGHRFMTQGDASRWAGVDKSVMSKHLNGLLPDANGFHFERISIPIAN